MHLNLSSSLSHINKALYFFWIISENERWDNIPQQQMDSVRTPVP